MDYLKGLNKTQRRKVKRSLWRILEYMDERDITSEAIEAEKEKIEALFKGNVKRDDLARIIKLARSSQDDVERHSSAVGVLADIWFTEEPATDEEELTDETNSGGKT